MLYFDVWWDCKPQIMEGLGCSIALFVFCLLQNFQFWDCNRANSRLVCSQWEMLLQSHHSLAGHKPRLTLNQPCVKMKLETIVFFSRITTVLFSCDQAALQMVFAVCLSVCLSVRPSHLFDYVPIIVSSWNFHELSPVTEVTSMQKVMVRGQRSRSQRSQPNLAVSGL